MGGSRQCGLSLDGHEPQQGSRGGLAEAREVEAQPGEGVATLLTLCQHAQQPC